jgi:hypothetical protein
MLFDILIIVVLLAVAVTNYFLITRKKQEDTEEIWLSEKIALRELNKRFQNVEDQIVVQLRSLEQRIKIQGKVIGDVGAQQFEFERDLLKRVELFENEVLAGIEQLEAKLVKRVSDDYSRHQCDLKKLSGQTTVFFGESARKTQAIEASQKELAGRIAASFEEQKAEIVKLDKSIGANFDQIRDGHKILQDHFDESMVEVKKELSSQKKRVNENSKFIKEESDNLKAKLESQLKAHTDSNKDLGLQIIRVQNDLSDKVENSSTSVLRKSKEELEAQVAALRNDLSDKVEKRSTNVLKKSKEESEAQVAALRSDLNDKVENSSTSVLEKSKEESEAQVAALRSDLNDKVENSSTSVLEKSKEELEAQVAALRSDLNDKVEKRSTSVLKKLESNLKIVSLNANKRFGTLEKEKDELYERGEENRGTISILKTDLVNIKENEESFIRHVKHQNQITKNIENLVNRSNTFNYNTFQVFNRRFIRTDYEETLKPILEVFNLQLSFNVLGYLAHKICKIEEDCVGRLATNIQDALIRLIAVFGIKREKCKILEIGTLFGINLCIVEELSCAFGKDITYQVIDPLDGYYKKGQLDIVTKLEVNSRNFWFNIRKSSLNEEKFELIKGFSHHKRVINKVEKNSLDLVFVDGDHTRKGVSLDIRNYYQAIRKGGYFVFDDYASRQWPEVQKAVDASRIIKEKFKFLARGFRTAIYVKK